MATLLDFRRRIRSVKNTQQITRAMKFVAAARLRRAQEAALAARPYAKELTRVLRSTISRIAEPQHPLLARRPEERVLALVLTGVFLMVFGTYRYRWVARELTEGVVLTASLTRGPTWAAACLRWGGGRIAEW